jgi:hypothetical protein
MILTEENRRTRRETCPGSNLSITNPTWDDLGANPGLHGEKPGRRTVSVFREVRGSNCSPDWLSLFSILWFAILRLGEIREPF